MPKHKPISMELFRSGTHIASNGFKKTWTNADIDKIVSNFNANDKVPACLGHPGKNEPAMGWYNKLWRKGDTLFGELGDRVDEFQTMIKNKMFPRRSISLDGNLNLKHVGFFGVGRVAIKGLENFAFSASEDEINEFTTIEFSEKEFSHFGDRFALSSIARLFTNLREKIIEKDGIEKADDIIQQHNIDSIEDAANAEPDRKIEPAFSTSATGSGGATVKFNQSNPEDPNMDELEKAKARITELEAQNKEFSEQITAKDTEIGTLKTEKEKQSKEFEEAKIKETEAEFSKYLDGIIEDGKLLPANKEANLSMLMNLNGQETLNYSEGDETKKKTPVDIFKANLEGAGQAIEFDEFATKDKSPESNVDSKLSTLTKARAAEKKISFSEAGQEIMNENPNLVLEHNIKSHVQTGGAN